MMITDLDDYFSMGCGRCARFGTVDCSTKLWAKGLSELRDICRGVDLEETVKWGHPCYMHRGRNIVIIGALRNDFRLSFFDVALMKDPQGVLERQGPNTQYPDMIRFTDNDQVATFREVIQVYLAEAIGYAAQGIRPPKDDSVPDFPEELTEALASDAELSEAFDALTPGRQKSYVINLNSAKKSETRYARMKKFRGKILSGKGALER